MSTPIAMPKLGMTMQEGTVIEWPIPLGGRVEKGQLVLIIESEKAEVEVEAIGSGILRHVYIEPGETVPCGTVLAALTETADEPFDAEAFRKQHEQVQVPRALARAPVAARPPRSQSDAKPSRGSITPAARATAKKLGIDPSRVPGSGPGGRVGREDVEAWAEQRKTLVRVAEGVSLEVPTQGEGDPVILLPGFGTDVSVFARQIPVLAERYRVFGVNPRGVGLSDAPDEDCYTPAVTADDAAMLADVPAHVVGTSLGAAAAIEFALRHPDRTRSLTLIAPFLEAEGRLLAVSESWQRLALEASPEALAGALLPWFFSSGYLADEGNRRRTLRGLAISLSRVTPTSLERIRAGLCAWSGTRTQDVGKITAPTLVIAGEEDALTPGGVELAALIPGAQSLIIERAGHALMLEAPDLVNSALTAHLAAA